MSTNTNINKQYKQCASSFKKTINALIVDSKNVNQDSIKKLVKFVGYVFKGRQYINSDSSYFVVIDDLVNTINDVNLSRWYVDEFLFLMYPIFVSWTKQQLTNSELCKRRANNIGQYTSVAKFDEDDVQSIISKIESAMSKAIEQNRQNDVDNLRTLKYDIIEYDTLSKLVDDNVNALKAIVEKYKN